MTRKMFFLMSILALPVAIYAQSDDMYFVPSKKKSVQKVERRTLSERKQSAVSTWDDAREADYHTGQLRDVDEYNRRGKDKRELRARLKGDTLYVQGNETLPEKEYLVRYSDNYAVDEPYDEDYRFSTRLYRYHGFYHYDPFMWDICFGWYDPWYDPWYGWYGPYYRHGWCSWYDWGWGWGHCHLGWHHGWGPGCFHGWAPAAPPRPYRPGGSALANGGRRPGSMRGDVSHRGGRNYADAQRGSAYSSRGGRGGVMSGTGREPIRGGRYNTPSRGGRTEGSYSSPSRGGRYSSPSRGGRTEGSYSSPSRGGRSGGSSSYSSPSRSSFGSGFSGGSRGGGFSGGGSRGGGGRGGR